MDSTTDQYKQQPETSFQIFVLKLCRDFSLLLLYLCAILLIISMSISIMSLLFMCEQIHSLGNGFSKGEIYVDVCQESHRIVHIVLHLGLCLLLSLFRPNSLCPKSSHCGTKSVVESRALSQVGKVSLANNSSC